LLPATCLHPTPGAIIGPYPIPRPQRGPMIRFTHITLTPVSKGRLTVQGRAHYDGSRGYPVEVRVRALAGRAANPWIGAPPVVMDQGYAAGLPLTFDLRFAGTDPAAPIGGTTDGVELALARPSQPSFL